MIAKKMIYIHHAPIRVWHWVNAIGFVFLILTGIQIRFAEHLSFISLEQAIYIHNYVGFMVIPNYFLWVLYYFGTGQMGLYVPTPKNLLPKIKEQVAFYSLGFFRGDPNPHKITAKNKFNVLQQATYAKIMFVLLPLQMVTGIFLWQIKQFENYIHLMGGIKIVNSVHVLLFFFFVAFMIGHIYMTTFGHTPLAHIKSMFTGYEEE